MEFPSLRTSQCVITFGMVVMGLLDFFSDSQLTGLESFHGPVVGGVSRKARES